MGKNPAEGVFDKKVKLNSFLLAAILGFVIHCLLPISAIFNSNTLSSFSVIPFLGWILYSAMFYLIIEFLVFINKRNKNKTQNRGKNQRTVKVFYERYCVKIPAKRNGYK